MGLQLSPPALHAPYFDARQAQGVHTPLQFVDCHVSVVHGQRTQPCARSKATSTTPAVACALCCPLVQCHTDEAIGCSGDDVCDAIVDDAREVCTVLIFGPVGEHDRHGGEDLAAEWGRCGHDHSQCGSSPCESTTNCSSQANVTCTSTPVESQSLMRRCPDLIRIALRVTINTLPLSPASPFPFTHQQLSSISRKKVPSSLNILALVCGVTHPPKRATTTHCVLVTILYKTSNQPPRHYCFLPYRPAQ